MNVEKILYEFVTSDTWLQDRATVKTSIRSIIKDWKYRLGMGDWQIKISYYREKYMATCYAEPEYGKAWLNFYLKRVMAENHSNYDLEELVVHELCHCHSWPLVSLTEDLINTVEDPTGRLLKSKEDYEELLISKMGHALVMSKYGLTEVPDTVRIIGWEGLGKRR